MRRSLRWLGSAASVLVVVPALACGGSQRGTDEQSGALPPLAAAVIDPGTGAEVSAVAVAGRRIYAAWQRPIGTPAGSDSAGARPVIAEIGAAGPLWRRAIGPASAPAADAAPIQRVTAMAAGGGRVIAALASSAPGRPPRSEIVAIDGGSGEIVWRRPIVATGYTAFRDLAVDSAGNIAAVGEFAGALMLSNTVALTEPGSAAGRSGEREASPAVFAEGLSDGLVLALDPGGRPRWVRRFGGSGGDAAQAVAIAGDRVLVAGNFSGMARLGRVDLMAQDESIDVVLASLQRADGDVVWVKSLGGRGTDTAAGLAIAGGNVGLLAHFEGSALVAGRQLAAEGATDMLLAVLSPEGEPRWARAIGSSEPDLAAGIAGVGDRFAVAGHLGAEIELDGQRYLGSFAVSAPAAAPRPRWQRVAIAGELRFSALAGSAAGVMAAALTATGPVSAGDVGVSGREEGRAIVVGNLPPGDR